MKHLTLILLVLFCSCSFSDEDSIIHGYTSTICYQEKVDSWRGKEWPYYWHDGAIDWDKAEEINDMVNTSIQYIPDQEAHGCSDYWQYSQETQILGCGDCEDEAILKYILMHQAGFPDDCIGVEVLYNPVSGGAHAVATIYDDDVYILAGSITTFHRYSQKYGYLPYTGFSLFSQWEW